MNNDTGDKAMSAPFDPKYYDKDEFHQGTVPAETMVSMHYSEVILKLLEQTGKGDLEEIKREVDRLLQTCRDQGNAIDYLKAKVSELEDGKASADQSRSVKAAAPAQSGAALWTRDKYGNAVRKSVGPSSYPSEFYRYHYGVSYNPRNPPRLR